MRKIREILRLKWECRLSNTDIASSCQISRETVRNYLLRAKKAQLGWPLPDHLDEEALENLLFAYSTRGTHREIPDWKKVHQALQKKGVTRYLLWEEYSAITPEGLSYSRFCLLYRAFKKTLDPVMRQTYRAGEVLFVDYAGMSVPWVDRQTGATHQAQIFVATLGASSYTYAEATASQKLPDWISSHVHAFEHIGGVPNRLVPDNLKAGVSKAHRYEPDINPTYQDLATHYHVAVVPARARKPKDKAKVEINVKGIEQRVLAPLRAQQFFSVSQINEAIRPLLTRYNARDFQKMPGSRLSIFKSLDQPALAPLPVYPYEYAQWKQVRVGQDYHVEFDHHFYSVPHPYIQQVIDLRITGTSVQCFLKGRLIAAHMRVYTQGDSTTPTHRPKSHQAQAEWTPERLMRWATQAGEYTHVLIRALIQANAHPQQAFRPCLGIYRLGKQYGAARLEKAAQRALALGTLSYKSIESILKHHLEETPLPGKADSIQPALTHAHVRGSHYYH